MRWFLSRHVPLTLTLTLTLALTLTLTLAIALTLTKVTLDVDEATHLVARKKEGWKSATKIRRALQRQATDA